MSIPKKVSYYKKPENLTVEEWQIALRRQFGIEQNFELKNTGEHPFFSDFEVFNPETSKTYKVAIRNWEFGMNFCSCPDFKVNGLGTCKHIEYVLYKLKQNENNLQYLNKHAVLPYSSLSLKYEDERKLYLRIGTENHDIINRHAADFFDKEGFSKPGKELHMDEFIHSMQEKLPDFKVYPDVYEYIGNLRKYHERQNKLKQLFSDGIKSSLFEDIIKTRLYLYQKEGVLSMLKAGRALIADEMGLGKTIQAIAATEVLIDYFGAKNVLIICPTSLKYQWKSEIEKFTNREVIVIEGLIHKRRESYKSKVIYKILSYGVIKNDLKYINEMTPDLVILDEAQRIKNWKTQTAQAVKKIVSEYVIVLTGTPLENRLEELHSIIEYIDRYKFGALFRFLYNHQVTDSSGKIIGYKNLNEINKSLNGVLIRRTKKEILDQLPGRIDKNYFVEMTEEQMNYHESYYDIVAKLVFKWRKIGYLNEEDRQRLLIALNCMRMVCDSTYILNQNERHDTKIREIIQLIEEIFENNEDKIVIFSQWKRMLDLLANELEERSIPFEFLHGLIPSPKRKQLIDNFHQNENTRIFLSTDAGGVGLNLQCASIVINIDIPWNPAVLEQRIARIYRLGQKNHVRVINFISHKSIEHRILYLLDFKKSVFKGVLDDGEDTVMLNENEYAGFMKSVEVLTKVEMENPGGLQRKYTENEAVGQNIITTDDSHEVVRQKEKAILKSEGQIEITKSKGKNFLKRIFNKLKKLLKIR